MMNPALVKKMAIAIMDKARRTIDFGGGWAVESGYRRWEAVLILRRRDGVRKERDRIEANER